MAQSISTSVPKRPPERNRTGCRRDLTANSNCCPVCMHRQSRCSTRHGSCRTSKEWRRSERKAMNHLRSHIFAGLALTGSVAFAQAQPSGNGILVTVDNFNRAETDMNFAGSEKMQGLCRFLHYREPMSIDFPIVRPNRDTLYSLSVFDLDA